MLRILPWSETEGLSLLERGNTPEMKRYLGGPESLDKLLERQERYSRPRPGREQKFRIVTPLLVSVGQTGYWERTWQGKAVYEVGWSVLPEYQGQGYASGALKLVLEALREVGTREFVHAFPSIHNIGSNRVCEKAGFNLVGECDIEFPIGHWMKSNDWRFDLGRVD